VGVGVRAALAITAAVPGSAGGNRFSRERRTAGSSSAPRKHPVCRGSVPGWNANTVCLNLTNDFMVLKNPQPFLLYDVGSSVEGGVGLDWDRVSHWDAPAPQPSRLRGWEGDAPHQF